MRIDGSGQLEAVRMVKIRVRSPGDSALCHISLGVVMYADKDIALTLFSLDNSGPAALLQRKSPEASYRNRCLS